MKKELAALICMSIIIIFPQPSLSFIDVGGDYGVSWLEEHGTKPKAEETRNNLWNWGSVPKGFRIYNGTLYPPGQGPQWYYPSYATEGTPIVINDSAAGALPADYAGLDPWPDSCAVSQGSRRATCRLCRPGSLAYCAAIGPAGDYLQGRRGAILI